MKISNQSLTTPATFIVSADVFPINKYTAMFNAKAVQAFKNKMCG
jgi:hypothetical protein